MAHLFLTDNLVDNATFSVITGTENSQYPLTNIQEEATTKTTRIIGNTVEILLDVGFMADIDTFCIAGKTTDGLGFTSLSIYGSHTTNFTSAAETIVDVSQQFNVGFKQLDSNIYRYWKLKFTGTGSFVEISNMYIGEAVSLTNNGIDSNTFSYSYQENIDMSINKYGNRFINKYNTLKTMSGQIKLLTNVEKNIVETFFSTVGKNKPFFFISNPDDSLGTDSKYRFSGYFYNEDDIQYKSKSGYYWNIAFSFQEVG